MVRLICVSWEFGWAYFHDGDACCLLRPPYAEIIPVPEFDAVRAVLDQGFDAVDTIFESVDRLILELELRVAPSPMVTQEDVLRLLRMADEQTTEMIIQSAIESKKEGVRDAIFGAALASETTRSSAKLLDQISSALLRPPRVSAKSARILKFPALMDRSQDAATYQDDISASGSLISAGRTR